MVRCIINESDRLIKKLKRELRRGIRDERQVIFVLSRIRKTLELKNKQGKYKFLNFYCNWALHTKIDRTESVMSELGRFESGKEYRDCMLPLFDEFCKNLKEFLGENDLPQKWLNKQELPSFINVLVDIFSDVPLAVCVKKIKIKINKTKLKLKNQLCGFSYQIVTVND